MVSDLTERLRKASFQEWQEYPSAHIEGAKWPVTSNIGHEAADEIERLTAALAEAERKLGEEITKAMHAEARATLRERSYQYARNDGVEEAAVLIEQRHGPIQDRQELAAAIRALKEKP